MIQKCTIYTIEFMLVFIYTHYITCVVILCKCD